MERSTREHAGTETTENPRHHVSDLLQDMVLESQDVKDFLTDLAHVSVAEFSRPGLEVLCGITLLRERRAATVASSSTRAQAMDEIQYRLAEGPCLSAARNSETIYVRDFLDEQRWPEYRSAVAGHGIRSVLGVPIPLETPSKCALNLYCTTPDGFSNESVAEVERFAREASKSLRLAVRVARLTDTTEDLKAAMQSRTVIDLAAGIIMGQNRCSQETAITILKAASSARNLKMHAVAASVVASLTDESSHTHFDQ